MKINVLFLSLLLTFASACGSSDERAAEEGQQIDSTLIPPSARPDPEKIGENQITGLLQTSGLQPQEAEALGLSRVRYQLISQDAYFLEGGDNLEAYLGQCVLLTGKEKKWEEVAAKAAEQTTYNRKLFVVEEVHPKMYSRCHFSDTLSGQPQGKEVVYKGKVERMQRPAPDIAYDYKLRLQKPYRDPNHPVQPGKLVETLPLFTASFDVLSKLEASVRQNVVLQVKGRQQQGYAEQEAVWVVAADSLRQ